MEQTILRFFEQIRCPALTAFFSLFSFLGESVTVGAAILLCYWLIRGRTGELVAFTSLTSLSFNAFLKGAVLRPRPYVAGDSSLLHVDTPLFSTADLGDCFSFPSGHTQASAAALFSAASSQKRRTPWLLAGAAVVLIAFSRMYFGVHYPTDVIAGGLFGLGFSLFWALIFRKAYPWRHVALGALAVFSLMPLFFHTTEASLQAAGLIAGAALFLPAVEYLPAAPEASGAKRLWRIPAGLLAVAPVFLVTLLFPEGEAFLLLTYVLLVGAGTLGAQALFRAFKI